MPDDLPRSSNPRLPTTSPEVFDWRLHTLETGQTHIEDQIGKLKVTVGEHGVRMEENNKHLSASVTRVEATLLRTENGVEKLNNARYQSLWQTVLAALGIIGTIIATHFVGH